MLVSHAVHCDMVPTQGADESWRWLVRLPSAALLVQFTYSPAVCQFSCLPTCKGDHANEIRCVCKAKWTFTVLITRGEEQK